MSRGKSIFITGTGTDIGKTYVTGLIVKKLRESGFNAGYYKAAVSGVEEGQLSDPEYVKKIAGIDDNNSPKAVSYVYKEAVSPHLAARINNRPIDFNVIEQDFQKARNYYDFLTIEGSGGIICPIRWDNSEHLILDEMIKRLNLPVLVISPAGLGSINAAVLTIEHLQNRQIPIKGIILNHWHSNNIMEEDNARMIEEITKIPIVAKVQTDDTNLKIDVNNLISIYE